MARSQGGARYGWEVARKQVFFPGCLIREVRCILEPRTKQQEQSAWRNYLGIGRIATLKISNDC